VKIFRLPENKANTFSGSDEQKIALGARQGRARQKRL
jgi:hypothetical protein